MQLIFYWSEINCRSYCTTLYGESRRLPSGVAQFLAGPRGPIRRTKEPSVLCCFRLACSFFTHTLLAAYWVQSELGDWDLHDSTDYLTSLCLAAPVPFSILENEVLVAESVAEEERLWSASVTGPPHPPPLVRLSASFLQQVALFHRSLRSVCLPYYLLPFVVILRS